MYNCTGAVSELHISQMTMYITYKQCEDIFEINLKDVIKYILHVHIWYYIPILICGNTYT